MCNCELCKERQTGINSLLASLNKPFEKEIYLANPNLPYSEIDWRAKLRRLQSGMKE
jgi:hypothetical protein